MRVRAVVAVVGLAAVSCLVAPAGVAGADEVPSVAVWSANCKFVDNKQVDPIGRWGEDPSPHMHSFAASNDPGPHATMSPPELRSADNPNECHSPDMDEETGDGVPSGWDIQHDLSSYWTPALRTLSVTPRDWFEPATALVYYRNVGVDPNTIRAFNRNFSIRAGNLDEAGHIAWACVAGKVQGVENELPPEETIPDRCPKYLEGDTDNPYSLRLVVYFPNCINFADVVVDTEKDQWKPNNPMYAEETAVEGVWECSDPRYDPIPQVQIGFPVGVGAGHGAPGGPDGSG